MTSRERVVKALNFEETDRVPIDIGGTQVSGLGIDFYCDLVRHLGIQETPKVYVQLEMLARVEEPVRMRLHSDVISLENPVMRWGLQNKNWKPWTTFMGNEVLMPGDFNPVEDEEGGLWLLNEMGEKIAYMAKGSLYFEFASGTSLSGDIIKMDPQKWKDSLPVYTDEELKEIGDNAEFLRKNTDYAIAGEFFRGFLGSSGPFAGHTVADWLCVLLLERDYAEEILDATVERALENTKLYLQAVGNNIDLMLISGTDYGTQRGELFNPELFKEIHAPRYRRINEYVHEKSDIKTFIHTCGSIYHLIESIIEAGFDVLNPLQITAANMDAKRLKEEFGGRIAFWGGGIDTQTVLPFGTKEEVIQQVRERIEIFAPGGGYIFNPTHCIQYGVTPENLLAVADEAFSYRRKSI